MENTFVFESPEDVMYEHIVLINSIMDNRRKFSVDIGGIHASFVKTHKFNNGYVAIFNDCNNNLINIIAVHEGGRTEVL